MNRKIFLFGLSSFLLVLACAFLTRPLEEDFISTPTFEQFTSSPTPTAYEIKNTCDTEIFIAGVDEVDLGDDTKIILIRMGFENRGSLWGRLKGPDDDWLSLGTEPPTYLTTKDSLSYRYSSIFLPNPMESLPNDIQATYNDYAGFITTELLPPGFSTLGVTYLGEPHYYNLAFQIPDAKEPYSVTIGEMNYFCIAPQASGSGEPAQYIGGGDLPIKTYILGTDITETHSQPPAGDYPSLVGSKLDLLDGKGSIEFTGVTRNGSEVIVTYNFTNLSSDDAFSYFNGYLIGESQLSTCQAKVASFCEFTDFNVVPSGQASVLSWVFSIPENETNLMFVYVYDGEIDLNKVYRIDP